MRRQLAVVSVLALICTGFFAAARAGAQDATPAASPPASFPSVTVTMQDADGNEVGTAILAEVVPGRVAISVDVEGLPAGNHGIHVHEAGLCEPEGGTEPFGTAGEHYNPTGAEHNGPGGGHAGDLGNIEIADDGTGSFLLTVETFTLAEGPTTLMDADGSALLIHENEDDLESQPGGGAGGRIACGVVFAPMPSMGTPIPGTPVTAATPGAAPDASPESSPEA